MAERIIIKSERQIALLRKAGKLTAEARAYGASLIRPGITTKELDKAMYKFIIANGGYPSFLHLYGFPGSACISVNDEVIHGIPGKRRLEEGDIVSIDIGACIGFEGIDKKTGLPVGGYHGDCAGTYPVGQISEEAKRLIAVTEESFWAGIANAVAGKRVSDISRGVQTVAEAAGFGVVRDFVGHGVGASVHEAPEVPNYVIEHHAGGDPRLVKNMVIAVEPMINAGTWRIKQMPDGWTVKTADGSYAAHYENTILITEGQPEVLTQCGD
jgi:methionyl aminopeptidase